jgi:hypothetical protein
LKLKIEELTIDEQWERCKNHIKKVHETSRSTFLKCQKGHMRKESVEYPVFMVSKSDVTEA